MVLVQSNSQDEIKNPLCLSRLRRCGADGDRRLGDIHAIYRPICSADDYLLIARERLFIYSQPWDRTASHVVRHGFRLVVVRAQKSSHTQTYIHSVGQGQDQIVLRGYVGHSRCKQVIARRSQLKIESGQGGRARRWSWASMTLGKGRTCKWIELRRQSCSFVVATERFIQALSLYHTSVSP